MSDYKILVGLEVHVQLLTKTKLFCGCSTRFGMRPNSQTCPVCIGMPGTLPVMNRRAFELAIKAAVALSGKIAGFSKWDRKQYYYPDLPKGYQISQYDLPFSEGGGVEITTSAGTKFVRLVRIHLEEDAGKNMHAPGGDSQVDLNRAGTPLLEIVSEPDMSSAEEAAAYLNAMRTLMLDLEISDCEMQEGSLRCDANVNIHITKDGQVYKTPIVEIKNMNSVRAVERAIDYEASRQYEQWTKDGKVFGQAPKQTRGWDDPRGITVPQREKEEASDYRYFPEPDLVPVLVDEAWINEVRQDVGESSAERAVRYQKELGLGEYQANTLVAKGKGFLQFFEALMGEGIDAKAAANWTLNDVAAHSTGRIKTMENLAITPGEIAPLIKMVLGNKLNLNDAREKVLPRMLETHEPADKLVAEMGLEVVTDTAEIDAMIDEVINDPNVAKAVADYRGGKEKAFGSIVGQVMRRSKGKFPPAIVNERLVAKLKS